jgi:TPR repeat protein
MDSRKRIIARMGWIAALILAIGATNAATAAQPQVRKAGIENDGVRDSSDAQILFDRGGMYYMGRGVAQDYAEAAKWFRLAADRGHVEAQGSLGWMYAKGQGVAQDIVEAAKWFRLAADQGDAAARFNLGLMYFRGQGVAQDAVEAVKWLRLAADQGHVGAQVILGGVYTMGEGVAQDFAEAAKWLRLAADQGDAEAQNMLGMMYAEGQGVAPDRIVAYALFDLSATNDPSKDNFALENRSILVKQMSAGELNAGQRLSREMARPGNLLKALRLPR